MTGKLLSKRFYEGRVENNRHGSVYFVFLERNTDLEPSSQNSFHYHYIIYHLELPSQLIAQS
jgi:hypothetical protein